MIAIDHQDMTVALGLLAPLDRRVTRDRVRSGVALIGVLELHRDLRLRSRHDHVGADDQRESRPPLTVVFVRCLALIHPFLSPGATGPLGRRWVRARTFAPAERFLLPVTRWTSWVRGFFRLPGSAQVTAAHGS